MEKTIKLISTYILVVCKIKSMSKNKEMEYMVCHCLAKIMSNDLLNIISLCQLKLMERDLK